MILFSSPLHSIITLTLIIWRVTSLHFTILHYNLTLRRRESRLFPSLPFETCLSSSSPAVCFFSVFLFYFIFIFSERNFFFHFYFYFWFICRRPEIRRDILNNIFQHDFFSSINWELLASHDLKAPYIPSSDFSELSPPKFTKKMGGTEYVGDDSVFAGF